MTRCAVASPAWMIPPMVLATATPMTSGPTKLKNAETAMAILGLSAPV